MVEFAPLPEAEAALVKNPHREGGKALCQRCHDRGAPGVKKDAIALCADCHDAARMRHPFRVEAPGRAAGKLPLLPGNLVACHTCHDPHGTSARRSALRMSYRNLCVACHEEHGSDHGSDGSPREPPPAGHGQH